MAKDLKYIDLFAGCGGLSTGLHLAGWRGLFAVERNPAAFLTLESNLIEKRGHFAWPHWVAKRNWDITDLLNRKARNLAKLNGQVDLVVGGPPCQGFSTAGRRRESDARNRLVHSYLKFVEYVRPRSIIFENVRGFTMKFKANPDAGVDYSQIVTKKLIDLGYTDARGEVIDMSDYGVPQRRQRFIVIATLEDLADSIFSTIEGSRTAFLKSKNIGRKNSAKAAISDLEKRHGVLPSLDTNGFDAGVMSAPKTRIQHCLRSGVDQLTPDSHRFVNHTAAVEAVFLRLLATAPRNSCISGDDRLSYGLRKRSVTVLDPNEPTPTVTTIPDDFVHYSEPRVMTVRECARLQTFPDWFEFKGPYTTGGKDRIHNTPRYTQVGNAVPPLFAELIGRATKEILIDG